MEHDEKLDLTAIGKRLKKVRTDNNLKQSEMADLLGLGRTIVSTMEKGDSSPTPATLFKLKITFNTSIDWLLTGKTGVENLPRNKKDLIDLVKFYLERDPDYFDHVIKEFKTTWKPIIDLRLFDTVSEDWRSQRDKA